MAKIAIHGNEARKKGTVMASGRQRNERSRNERIYQKFARNVEDGNFYEASQVVKTLYFR